MYTSNMNLVMLCGPPAVGKLTIAQLVSEATGVPLFHNHESRNIVKKIYPDSLDAHYDLVQRIRLDVYSYCASHGTDLITTFVYEGPDDDDLLHEYKETIESHGGKIIFIQLYAASEDLLNRVTSASRVRHKKIINASLLKNHIKNLEKFKLPFTPNLEINTSKNSPQDSAARIREYLTQQI